jgi:hypothetical protein
MGFFSNLLMKITIKKSFGKYINKKDINEIMRKNNCLSEKKFKKCGYIIIEIIQNDFFEANLKSLLSHFNNTNFMSDIYGTILVFTLFESLWNKDFDITIGKIENSIKNIFNENIRGIYGIDNAIIGNFGTEHRMHYMALFNDFYKKIIKINGLKYGEIKEYSKI